MARKMKSVAREKIGTRRQREAAAHWLREARPFMRARGGRVIIVHHAMFYVLYSKEGVGLSWHRFTADGVMEYQEIESATRKAA